MIISREMDYAVRIIRQLNKTRISNAALIETEECMSRDFARKILGKLKRAGIVSSGRGACGGYSLNVSLDNISLLDLKKIIEPGPIVNKCMREGYSCPRNGGESCMMHKECLRLEELIETEMSKRTLADLI